MDCSTPFCTDLNPSFTTDDGLFDVTKKKSKDYYFFLPAKKHAFLILLKNLNVNLLNPMKH